MKRRLYQLIAVFLVFTGFYGAARAADDAAATPLYILALGDSLTAGYELDPEHAFPVRLEQTLRQGGLDVTVINGGVSGDTSSGGLSRLDWTLGDVPGGTPDLVIVELGANDALRGIDPALTRQNLSAIIERFQADGVTILLAGMRAPPNMGDDYAAAFDGIYPDLAAEYDLALYPFFLDGVAAEPSLNLEDGMHPNAEGVEVIVTRIAPMVKSLLTNLKAD